ncbi:hypothetical protein ACA910_017606 [Epithemia clementina (nom. ined.)]
MDTVLGVQYNGGVVMACDQSNAFSILVKQSNLDKLVPMTEYSVMGVSGPQCDANNFSQYVAKNLQFYHYASNQEEDSNGKSLPSLSLQAQAHFTRNELAQALRRAPYQVNLIYGGIDPMTKEPALYIMDYLASLHKVQYGAQGYSGYFCLSVFDRAYQKPTSETTLDDALAMIQQCIHELKTRFLFAQPNFLVKVVDEQGIRIVSQGADPLDN